MTDGLKFGFNWEDGESVRAPELSATWARLEITASNTPLTLVRESSSGDTRPYMYVSLYPLAEWIAFNWWFLTTPTSRGFAPHGLVRRNTRTGDGNSLRDRFCLSSAGDGFPWPEVHFLPEQGAYLLSATRREDAINRVQTLIDGDFVLDFDETVYELARFVEMVTVRLADREVLETPLQTEWSAIRKTDDSEAEFNRAAASLGIDPYAADETQRNLVLETGNLFPDPQLRQEILPLIRPDEFGRASIWLNESTQKVTSRVGDEVEVERSLPPETRSLKPWVIGYRGAQEFRSSLKLELDQDLAIREFIALQTTRSPAPSAIEGISMRNVIAVPSGRSKEHNRFVAARALYRSLMTSNVDAQLSLIGDGATRADRIERAFAAEVLAPAEGIRLITDGTYSFKNRNLAAKRFGVGRMLIDYQIDNQLLGIGY